MCSPDELGNASTGGTLVRAICLIIGLLIGAAGCRSDDFPGRALGVDGPDLPFARSNWELRLLGVPIATEQRRVGERQGSPYIARYRYYRLQRPQGEVTLDAASAVALDARGGALTVAHRVGQLARDASYSGGSWTVTAGGLSTSTPIDAPPVALELLGGAALRALVDTPVNALIGDDLGVESTRVVATPTGVRWRTTRGDARAELEGNAVQALVWGALSLHRVDVARALPPVALDRLLRVQAPLLPAARAARRLRGVIGDHAIAEDRPLLVELPRHAADGGEGVGAALPRWVAEVNRALKRAPEPGGVDAMTTLAAGAGDCNEWAAVLVAFAERDGAQARVVSGLVYMPDGTAGALVPHAWAEVRAGDDWVPTDPILGQPIADATHIRLAIGPLGDGYLAAWPAGALRVTAID